MTEEDTEEDLDPEVEIDTRSTEEEIHPTQAEIDQWIISFSSFSSFKLNKFSSTFVIMNYQLTN